MKIYLDYILIENIIVNFVIIYQLDIFTKSNRKKRYCFFSSLILSFYTVITYINNSIILSNIFIKILTVNIAIYIAFFPKTIIEFLKKIVYYYIISFTYVGVIISITLLLNINIDYIYNKVIIYLICAIISYLFNKYMWKMWKTNIKKENMTYIMNINGQEIPSYIDTGNLAHDYLYNLDVIFLDKRWYKILNEKGILNRKIDVGIKTVSDDSFINGYIVKNVDILKNGKKVCRLNKIIFSFSNKEINIDGKYTALIGYNLYLENLKGVTL